MPKTVQFKIYDKREANQATFAGVWHCMECRSEVDLHFSAKLGRMWAFIL